MRVLHILDMAGIGSMACYYLNKHGVESEIYYHKKNNIGSQISEFYKARPFPRFKKLLVTAILNARKYDIIHIHSAEILVPIFRILGKKVILEYHGSDINESRRYGIIRTICRSMADVIIYNDISMNIHTMKNTKKIFLANLIDQEHFKPSKVENKKPALSLVSDNLNLNLTVIEIKKYSLSVDIFDISKTILIPYSKMPEFLSNYRSYVDEKVTSFGLHLKSLSTTALQALSCGLTVFHDGKEIKILPQENRPEYYTAKLITIYQKTLNQMVRKNKKNIITRIKDLNVLQYWYMCIADMFRGLFICSFRNHNLNQYVTCIKKDIHYHPCFRCSKNVREIKKSVV